MQGPYVAALHQRTLCAVYRFYNVFMLPVDDRTPPVSSALEVSIPSLGWNAMRVDSDHSYRFSAVTLTQPAPNGPNLPVQVLAPAGDYVNHDAILLSLPLALSAPPLRGDFLIRRPLWPTTALRPPAGETGVRGHIHSPTAQPVAGLKVEMWTGAALVPSAGTPFTRSNADGDFLFRFPLLKGSPGQSLPVHIRLDNGLVPASPASLSIVTGQTQIIPFQRT